MVSAPPPASPSSPPPPSPSSSPPPPSSPPPSPSSPPPSPPSSPPPSPPPTSPPPPPPSKNSPPPPPPSSDNDVPYSSPPPPTYSPPPPPPSKSDDVYSPPPPKSLRPPPPKEFHPSRDNSPSETQESSGGGDHVLPIAIGVAASLGLLFLIALLAYLCTCRKKKKRSQNHDYYPDHYNRGSKAHYYPPAHGPHALSNNWHNGSQHHNQGNIPPPPGGSWQMQVQPPPPPGISSSEMSSNYSGPQGPPLPPPHPSVALGFSKSSFTYDELAHATSGFSPANLLGQGGFGYVHKGVLPNGKEIAVKSLKAGSGQGDREFQAEVEIISRVHHRHLVSLVGYCIAGGQKLLVYEFVPNFTLEHHLHGKGHAVMDWPKRMKIALGSAKGLAYLHEDCHPKIIHRDIKAANILLDYNFEAKVADFGLAKLSTDTNTHVSTRVMGTFGYLAPEYAASGKLTEKSDVFSFGVMLLELITGRRPIDLDFDMDESLVDWARPLCEQAFESGDYSKLVDPMLEGEYDPQELARMVACASSSVRHSGRRRPKMSQIVRALEGDLTVEQIKDGNGMTSSQSAMFSVDFEGNSYASNMRQLRKQAMESTEYASSEYGQTGEYGNSRHMA